MGRIGLSVRFDGRTNAIVDETAAVAAPIGSGGGTIAVEGMELAIPAGAVPEGTTITATPLRSLRGSPLRRRRQFFEDPNATIERFDGRKV